MCFVLLCILFYYYNNEQIVGIKKTERIKLQKIFILERKKKKKIRKGNNKNLGVLT